MIRIDAVIASEKVSMVVDALKKVGVGGITVFDAKGWGKGRRSQITSSRGRVAILLNIIQETIYLQ